MINVRAKKMRPAGITGFVLTAAIAVFAFWPINSALAAEMVTNGIFASSCNGWTVNNPAQCDGAKTKTADLSASVKVSASGRNTSVSSTVTQNVSIASGSVVNTVSLWSFLDQQVATCTNNCDSVTVALRYADTSTVEVLNTGELNTEDVWVQAANSPSLTLSQNVTEIIVTLRTKTGNNNSATTTLWVDEVSIQYTPLGADTIVGDGSVTPGNQFAGPLNADVEVCTFDLRVSSGPDDTATQIVVTNIDGTTAANASAVKLYRDNNTNAVYDPGTDTFIQSTTFSGATATLSGLSIAVGTSATQYLITYDIVAGPTNGQTMQCSATSVTATLNPVVNNDDLDGTVTIDSLAPVTTANPSVPFDTWTTASPVDITFSVNDGSGSGAASGYPKHCNDTNNTCTPDTSGADSVSCSADTVCVTYVRYNSVDNVGNTEAVQSGIVRQDRKAPAISGFTASSGNEQCSLGWSASDQSPGSGLHSSQRYKVVFDTSGYPSNSDCTNGTILVDWGLLESTVHGSLTNGIPYYYRLCAKDNLNNLSTQTASCTPSGSGCVKTIGSCSDCHEMPPLDSVSRNKTTGAVKGDHQVLGHQAGAAPDTCVKCHGLNHGSNYNHRNSLVEVAGVINGGSYSRGTSFAHSNNPSLGYCSNTYCHGRTNNSPVWGTGATNCDSCHRGNLNLAGKHTAHWESTSVATETERTAAGNNSTSGNYIFTCAVCHFGAGHINNPVNSNRDAEITFNVSWAAPSTGTHTEGVTSQLDARGYRYSSASCTSLYCHSDAKESPSYRSVNWADGTTLGCGDCHGAVDVEASVTLSYKHPKHAGSDSYAITCDDCHALTVGNDQTSAISNKAEHVDGGKDVKFSTTMRTSSVDQSGGTTSGGGSGRQCISIYCHSGGVLTSFPFTAPQTTPTWGGTAVCSSCHRGVNNEANRMNTDKHDEHVLASPNNSGVRCSSCHASTVSGTNAVTSKTLHINGAKDVIWNSINTGGTAYVNRTTACANIYCHSKGTSYGTYTGTNISPNASLNWNDAHSESCANCHDNPPAYPNPTTIDGYSKPNSHGGHSAYTCEKCHYGTTNDGVSVLNEIVHANKSYGLSQGPGVTFTVSVQGRPNPGGQATGCTNISCHGGLGTSATWGATLKCSSCHSRTNASGGDQDDKIYNNGTMAKINSDEWSYSGHGKTSSTYDRSGNPAANFPGGTATGDPCLYCHIKSVGHGDGGNFFRLRTNGYSGTYQLNGACRACHEQGSSGVDPDGGGGSVYNPINGSSKINKYHFGLKHTNAEDGGKWCWDCHDPHGDSLSSAGPIIMVQKQPAQDSNVTNGVWITQAGPVVFDNNTVGTGAGGFAMTSGTYTQGICNTCHTATSQYTRTLGDNGHDTSVCRDCHKHGKNSTYNGEAFKGEGTCKSCHAAGTSKDMQTEFGRNSHHISKTWANMLDADCVVCHAEGTISGGVVSTNSSYHRNPAGVVDLYNADNRGTIYTITISQITGKNDAANDSFDTFCMSCHDSNGANAVGGADWPSGDYIPANPFGETSNIRTNSYDGIQKTFSAGGGGLNVYDDFYPGTGAGSLSRDNHHAVRGKRYSTRLRSGVPAGFYTLYQSDGSNTNLLNASVNLYDGTTGVFDDSTLHCNDCHSSAWSSHGSANEYLLQLDYAENPTVEHTWNTADANGQTYTYVCFKCHKESTYMGTGNHVSNSADYQHSSQYTGTARKTSAPNGMGHMTGISCLNCHDGAVGFGGIHGFPDAQYTAGSGGSGQGTYWKRRFMPGSGLIYYDPKDASALGDADWEATAGNKCYTLSSATTMSSCTKHDKGTSMNARDVVRKVDY